MPTKKQKSRKNRRKNPSSTRSVGNTRNQQQQDQHQPTTPAIENDDLRSARSVGYTRNQQQQDQHQPTTPAIREDDIPDDVFEEFLKWSLSDKKDINSKKFRKKAPLAAKWLLQEGSSGKAERLQDKRNEIMIQLQKESEMFHTNLPRNILIDSMSSFFRSEGEKIDFGQQLDALLKRNEKKCLSPTDLLTNTFEELAEKWSTQRGISLDNHRYYQNNPHEFSLHFKEDKNKIVKKKSDVFQRYEEIRKTLRDATTYLFYEVGSALFTFTGGFQHRDNCWECEKEYISVCSGCQCAKYCSKACQVKHWKSSHKDKCKDIDRIWSMHTSNKKRVEKAIKDKRISTTCLLPPSPSLDIQLCYINSISLSMFSMDTFYKNIENLKNGGTHPIFGNQTLSSKLRHVLDFLYLGTESEEIFCSAMILNIGFNKEPLQQDEIDAMGIYALKLFSDVPSHDKDYWEEQIRHIQKEANLTIDKFLILYLIFDPRKLHLTGLMPDKYMQEFIFLTRLKFM